MKRRRRKLRSSLEDQIVPDLVKQGARYEPIRLPFAPKPRFYIPDLVLPNGIVVEIKGWFQAADRSKMLLVQAQYPALDLRMVLASPQQPIRKGSKTTQATWCEAHGIPWAKGTVPARWMAEEAKLDSLAVVSAAPKRRVK